MVKQFKLAKTGAPAAAEILKPSHLTQVVELHEATRQALPDAQKMFVLPQEGAYFEKFLTQKNGLMLGITSEGKLIAQLVVMGPLPLEEAIQKHAITRNEVAFHHVGPMDTIVAIKSMAVHPEFRGNELSQHLVTSALDLPLVQQADHAFAQISVDNVRSWELFLKNGFGIAAAAIDPGDQKPRFILQKPNEGFNFEFMPSADDVDPVGDFQAIMRLTQREALIGHIDPVATTQGLRLAFSSSVEFLGPLPMLIEEAG